jgi:hypothetical protein
VPEAVAGAFARRAGTLAGTVAAILL